MKRFIFLLLLLPGCVDHDQYPIPPNSFEELTIVGGRSHYLDSEVSIWIFIENKNPKQEWTWEITVDGETQAGTIDKDYTSKIVMTDWGPFSEGTYDVTGCIYSANDEVCKETSFIVHGRDNPNPDSFYP